MSPIVTRNLHILAAVWTAAGVFASAVLFALLKRTADPAGRAFGARLAWRLMVVYTLPGAVVSGLLGLYQLMAAGYGFRFGWVHASVTLWVVLLVILLAVQLPRLRAAARTGGDVPRVVAILTHVNALLIVVMTVLMGLKPF